MLLASCNPVWATEPSETPKPSQQNESEPHLANIQQLTFFGKNAEAYFSPEVLHVATFSREADGFYFPPPILMARTARPNFHEPNITDGHWIITTFFP